MTYIKLFKFLLIFPSPFFVVSFILWFVSCGLLTVLWALAIGLLGMLHAANLTCFFSCHFVCFVVNFLSFSQSLSCMQVLEHLIWKHVWTHSVKNFVRYGAIIASCSLHELSWMWVKLSLDFTYGSLPTIYCVFI